MPSGAALKTRASPLFPIAAAALLAIASPRPGAAQDPVMLPAEITFATSTGYWTDSEAATSAAGQDASPSSQKTAPRHGYYKLYAVRQPDRTSKVYLQQIAVTDDGLQVLSTVELRELTEIKPYVTDITPEYTDGPIREPGMFATIVLKTDPDGETERWRVAMDDLGEITVEKPSE
jgi:hypothetical protein